MNKLKVLTPVPGTIVLDSSKEEHDDILQKIFEITGRDKPKL